MCEPVQLVQEEFVTVCSPDQERREPECVINTPKDDSQEISIQKWVDTEMKLLKSLYDRMVINYYRMAKRCHGCEKQLDRCKAEINRIMKIAHRVTRLVKELGCKDLEKCSTNFNDDVVDDTWASIGSLEECCKALTKELRTYKKLVEDGHRERDVLLKERSVLDEKLTVANEQLAVANGQLVEANRQLVAANGQLTTFAGTESKLRKHADDLAKQCEKRLSERSEQCEMRLSEQTEKHGDEICRLKAEHVDEFRRLTTEHAYEISRLTAEHADESVRLTAEHADEMGRLTAEHDEKHVRELRRLTDELDATKSSCARDVDELRKAMHELSARGKARKAAAADQRASIARLTALLCNKREFERSVCSRVAEPDEPPPPPSEVASTGNGVRVSPPPPPARDPQPTTTRAHVATVHVPWSPSSTDSSVTYDMVRYSASVVPPTATVLSECCAVDATTDVRTVVADGTSDSAGCTVNDDHDHDHVHRSAGRDATCSPVHGCGDVTEDQAAPDRGGGATQSPEHLCASPTESDNSETCGKVYMMRRLIDKYKCAAGADS